MSVCLKVEGYSEFFSQRENADLISAYLDEFIGEDRHKHQKEEIGEYFKDKHFFQINKAGSPIGFGAYKEEFIQGRSAFMLYEFFVAPKYRDVSQLYEIKRQIIVALKILDKAIWTCCVENDDEKRKRAYEKLGFSPMFEDEGLLIMGMEMENL